MANKTNLITRLVISVFLLAMVSTATGRTIYVDDDGPADFNNIQAAINDSYDGDIVVASAGAYTSKHNIDHKKALRLENILNSKLLQEL